MTAIGEDFVSDYRPMPYLLRFDVFGTPAPQGSKRHVGRGIMVESSKALKPWREAVKHAALDAVLAVDTDRPSYAIDFAVHADITLFFARPKKHYRTGKRSHALRTDAPRLHIGKPDGDKVLRSCFDALKDAGVLIDDSIIATASFAKLYADHRAPGACITVSAA